MSVRMRHTSGHTANRRSHHGLEGPRLSTCKKCSSQHLRHRMCDTCGQYKGREVIDVATKIAKRAARVAAKQGIETATKAEIPQNEESTETPEKEEKK